MRFREHLWAHGFGVAEAMDTAQRGMGLSWAQARELIAGPRPRPRTRAHWRAGLRGGDRPAAAGADHGIGAIVGAYAEQVAFVQSAGAQVILMASRALAARARGPPGLPGGVRRAAEAGGPAGDAALAGRGVRPGAARLLGQQRLRRGRRDRARADRAGPATGWTASSCRCWTRPGGGAAAAAAAGVRLYTGDDFNYAELIRGDADGLHSDALLGAFAAITAPAAAALAALDRGDLAGYDAPWRRRSRSAA